MNKKKSVNVYRVEDPVGQHGLWRDFDGTKNPVFDKLTVGKSRTLLMEDSPFYGDGGKRWFAATDEPEKLKAWFDALDIEQLVAMGYGVYEFEVSCVRIVSEYEVVFTRDSIIRKRQINPDTIWGYGMKSEG